MKKYLLLINVFLLTACTGVKLPDQLKINNVKNPATSECLSVAKYARSIGVLKEAGISIADLDDYMKTPLALKVPMQSIQDYSIVFNGNPGELYNDILNKCEMVGWINLGKYLNNFTPSINSGLKLSKELKVYTK